MKTAEQLIAEAKAQIKEIAVSDLHYLLSNHHTIFIDVREPSEFQAGHVDRAINIPRGVLEMKIATHPEASNHCDVGLALQHLAEKPIYLMCATGGRSALASLSLQNMGFTQVYSVQGGFQAWQQAGYAIES